MPNPFARLQPALSLISREAKVLPATGNAVEDLTRPDHAEVIDNLRIGEDGILDTIIETPRSEAYVPLVSIHRKAMHTFRYFIDGSARTFFLGDAVVRDKQRTPIHVSQIGAAAVVRQDDGHVRIAGSVHKIALMMNKKSVNFGDEVEKLIAQAGPRFVFHDLMEEDGETEKTAGKEPRSRAPHKAHHLMAMEEENLGRTLLRQPGQWMILDGNLGKDLHRWGEVRDYLGVAKSFSREPHFRLPGPRGGRQVNLYELIAELPFSARTCAFSVRSGKAAVWYVRLQQQGHLDYPLMGVIKVEFPNPTCGAVPSALIDELTSALIAERCVTPHGKDTRWHAHLYPIYLAEQTVKNGFVSTEVLKAGIKWPMQLSQTV